MMGKTGVKGFTLVELMVVVGIIAILGAVGAPMYSSHVKKTRASEGATVLTMIKAKQELYRSTRFVYASNLSDLPGFDADTYNQGDYFQVTIVSADRNSFVARAWDGQKHISDTDSDYSEEFYITNDLDEPCRTSSELYDTDDPCVETVKAAIE